MKNHYAARVFFILLVTAAVGLNQLFAQTPEYATGTLSGTGGNTIPFYYLGSGCRGQQLYPAGAFGTVPAGQYIDKIYFSSTTTGSQLYSNMEVLLKQANISSLSNTYETGMTTVLSETNYTINRTALQWFGIELETPFLYNPNLPIIVEINQLTSGGASHSSLVQSPTISGSWRNYASGYNAAAASGNGAYTLFFGFDLSFAAVPNNAGVTDIPSLVNGFCADTVPVEVEITNFGNNVIDSVYVDWSVNNVPQPGQWFNLGLDTAGSADNDTLLTIGNYLFVSGQIYDIQAWTSLPNNELDTVNTNDTTSASVGPALEGTYIIGSSGSADYATFTAAAADLNLVGVCDDVIFEVESGTYSEQFALNQILGSSSDHTVTFRSQAQDSSAVTLSFAGTATQNAIVKLNGADWVRFEKMTLQNTSTSYDAAFEFTGGADYNIVSNCRLIGNIASTATAATLVLSTSSIDKGNEIRNNLFEGSGYGIYFYGSATTSLEPGTIVENNRFINQYYHGIRLYYQDAPKVRNNFVMSNSAYGTGYGIYLGYCDNSTEVSSNHVMRDPNSANTWPYYGMYITTSDGIGLNNAIRIFNNRVVIGADYGSGSTATFYGIYLTTTNAVKLMNNSATILSGGATSRAMYQTACDINFHNNNLYTNYGTGQAAYYASGISIDINNNNYYAPYGQEIYYLTTNYDVNTFTAATGFDSAGHNYNPNFSDMFQAFVCNDSLDGTAEPISFIPTDYSGFPRNATNPDPGAVEFIGVNNFSLGGNDTLCASSHVFEVTGPTSNIGWSVNGFAHTGNSVSLSNSNSQPQVFNVVVVFTSATGCGSASASATVTLVPDAELDPLGHLCAGSSTTLTPGGGGSATYTWTPDLLSTPSITVDEAGTYSVTKTEMGCVSSASTVITQSVAVNIPDVQPCDDELPYELNATIPDGLNYAWNGGTNINSAINSFNDEGSYSITVTDTYGCVSMDDFVVDVIGVPTAVITESHFMNYYIFSSASSFDAGSDATYLWNFGDGDTSHAANPTHAYAWTGLGSSVTYTVSLTVINNCGSHTTTFDITPDPLAVEELGSSNAFSVFPNPAIDVFTVRFAKTTNVQVELLDLGGRVVKQMSKQAVPFIEMPVGDLASGAYLLKVTAEGVSSYTSLIIE